jgi:hypothetical protein
MSGQLWRSDGTLPGTFALDKPASGLLTRIGEHDALFESNEHVWRTDGTPGNFTLVSPADPTDLLGTGNFAYIATSTNLLRTDGTAAGTKVVVQPSFDPAITNLIALGSNVCFVQANRWRFYAPQFDASSDVGALATPLAVFTGKILYTGNGKTGELWAKASRASQNERVSQQLTEGYRLVPLDLTRDTLLFVAGRNGNAEPWVTNGTPNTTVSLGRPATRLTGRVIDGFTKAAITDADVVISSTNGARHELSLPASGSFAMLVGPGDYSIAASSRSGRFISATTTLVVAEGKTTDTTIELFRANAISGRVVDTNGVPIADHPIFLSPDYRRTSTNLDGVYEITPPSNRSYVVTALESDDHSGMIYEGVECWDSCSEADATRVVPPVGARATNIDFVLKRHGIVRGRLFDAITGAPIVDQVAVRVRARSGREETATVENGVYSVEIPDGGATIEAVVSAYRITTRVMQPVPAGTILEGIDLSLQPIGARIIGRAIDVQSGQAIPDLPLLFEAPHGVPITKVTTGADGSFATGGWFAAGSYSVRPLAGSWQFQPGAEIVVSNLGTVHADVLLTRSAILNGVVEDRVTRRPIHEATVTITNTSTNETITRTTDFNGRYTASFVAGTILVRATKNGWREGLLDGGAVSVAPGETFDTKIRMAPKCTTRISPDHATFDADGGTGRVTVHETCTVCAFSSPYFVAMSRWSCANAGTIEYTVGRNRGPARTGWILVPGGRLKIDQRAEP